MTPEILAACTGAPLARAELFTGPLAVGMAFYAIDTLTRKAMFLANVGHESGGLKYTTELWGPTPAQKGYEGRADLGNTQPGDGSKYRGHGLFQTTGRANHRAVTMRLRERFNVKVPDFEAEPTLLADAMWAALSACDYVDMRRLNMVADSGDFVRYVKGVNGGINGLADRQRLYATALEVLA